MHFGTLCFTWGLSPSDLGACRQAASEMHMGDTQLCLVPIGQETLPRTVREVIDEHSTKPIAQGGNKPSATGSFRMVLMHTKERGEILQIMRRLKSVLSTPNDVIFAMITDTALGWTFQYYLDHVAEEHEYMKHNRPQDNPDMRPM